MYKTEYIYQYVHAVAVLRQRLVYNPQLNTKEEENVFTSCFLQLAKRS